MNYVELTVSRATFDEVKRKLAEAGIAESEVSSSPGRMNVHVALVRDEPVVKFVSVNSVQMPVEPGQKEITYEQVSAMAEKIARRQLGLLSVLYWARGTPERGELSGILAPREKLELVPGLHFDAVNTGNA